MKKYFLLIAVICAVSCSEKIKQISLEYKAKDAINKYVQEHFYDPKSYESISISPIEKLMGKDPGLELQYKGDSTDIVSIEAIISLDSLSRSMDEIYNDKDYIDSIKAEIPKLKEKLDVSRAKFNKSIDRLIGYQFSNKFRCKAQNGNFDITTYYYTTDTLFKITSCLTNSEFIDRKSEELLREAENHIKSLN